MFMTGYDRRNQIIRMETRMNHEFSYYKKINMTAMDWARLTGEEDSGRNIRQACRDRNSDIDEGIQVDEHNRVDRSSDSNDEGEE